jgi:cellobiose-specific phosphotransferase system component IIC
MPALAAVVAGVVLGLGSGGTLGGLKQFRLQWEWLILPLFVVQAVSRGRLLGVVGASQWSLVVWVGASAALAVALLKNWRIPGLALGALGILMNVDVVLLNHAMPVAANQVGTSSTIAAAEVALSSGGFYRLSAQADLLSWLGDSMPVELGRSAFLLSPGDVVLMVAVVVAIVYAMCATGGTGPES